MLVKLMGCERLILLFFLTFFPIGAPLGAADVVQLRSGDVVKGTLLGADSRAMQFVTEDGQVRTFPISDVKSITFASSKDARDTNDKDAGERDAEQGAATGLPEVISPRARSSGSHIENFGRDTADGDLVVPGGTTLTVRMIDAINSEQDKPGEVFRASLDEDLIVSNNLLAPRGANATVELVEIREAGQLRGREELSMILRDIAIGGKIYPVTTGYASVAGESRGEESVQVIGGTTAAGAIIGAIAGGAKGAAVGAATGAGAGTAIQVLRGTEVKIPSESRLAFTLAEPLQIERDSPDRREPMSRNERRRN